MICTTRAHLGSLCWQEVISRHLSTDEVVFIGRDTGQGHVPGSWRELAVQPYGDVGQLCPATAAAGRFGMASCTAGLRVLRNLETITPWTCIHRASLSPVVAHVACHARRYLLRP